MQFIFWACVMYYFVQHLYHERTASESLDSTALVFISAWAVFVMLNVGEYIELKVDKLKESRNENN